MSRYMTRLRGLAAALILVLFVGLLPLSAQSVGYIALDSEDLQIYPASWLEGQTVTVTVVRLSGTLQPLVGIQTPNGRIVERTSSNGSGTVSLIYIVPESGEYAVVVGQSGTDSITFGEFMLTMTSDGEEGDKDDGAIIRTPILFIRNVYVANGQIEESNPEQGYSLYLETGERIEVVMSRETSDSAFIPVVGLTTLSGQILARGRPLVEGQSTLTFIADETGWYRVALTRFDTADSDTLSGRYKLYIVKR